MNIQHFQNQLMILLLTLLTASVVVAEENSGQLSDKKKLKLISADIDDIPNAYRLQNFVKYGEVVFVGKLVTIGHKIYFKTADQSYIPEDRRFPYPELFFELYLSQIPDAYRPLYKAKIIKKNILNYDGPIQIKGNWAYDSRTNFFVLTWVDEVTKVSESPEGDWSTWLKDKKQTTN